MVRVYIVPRVGLGTSRDAFRPKYIRLRDGIGVVEPGFRPEDVVWKNYGYLPVFLLIANFTLGQHAILSAQPDVLSFPEDLDSQIDAAALPGLQARLEALDLPAHWLTTGHTSRQAVNGLWRCMSLMQRYSGLRGDVTDPNLFDGTIALKTTWNDLPAAVQERVREAATSLGVQDSSVAATMTVGDGLWQLASQLPAPPVILGETFSS